MFNPWVRKIPWRREWNLLQYFCLENSMYRGTWRVTVHGVTKSQTWLRDKHFTTVESEPVIISPQLVSLDSGVGLATLYTYSDIYKSLFPNFSIYFTPDEIDMAWYFGGFLGRNLGTSNDGLLRSCHLIPSLHGK